ncbi:MAG: hypothetical protein H8D56_01460 [Planctomycetes bacterium]|nr:hypothetical protein [Planctomycetota bacterium]MBL7143432.1 hypothetical protein [Phycisphaerae bacterium]
MNEKDLENDKIEHLLRRAHPSEPTPLLKERIITEARKAWDQTSLEMPWQIPIRRLVASVAAAVLIISIANFSSDHILEKWNPGNVLATKEQPLDLEILPDMPYRPFVRHTVSINRKPSIDNASALRDYTERVRQVINEMQQNGISDQPVPDGGRSRLFPTQPVSDSYS